MQEFSNAIIHGKTWTFIDDQDSGGIVALDQGGQIMDAETAMELFSGVEKFTGFYGNENIRAANRARSEEALQNRDAAIKRINSSKTNESGCVYFLRGTNGLTKIGMSTRDADKRLNEFSPRLPFDTELVHVINCQDPFSIELSFHERFAEKRVRGEWFELSDDDICEIKHEKD